MSEHTMHDIDIGHIRQQAKEQSNPWAADTIYKLCNEVERLREENRRLEAYTDHLQAFQPNTKRVRDGALEAAAQVVREMKDSKEAGMNASRTAQVINKFGAQRDILSNAEQQIRELKDTEES